MAKKKNAPKHTKLTVLTPSGSVVLYADKKIAQAVEHFLNPNTSLYEGVKLVQIIEVAFEAGKKTGRAEAVATLEEIKGKLEYHKPGRPKKGS
jgi:hypothetical protein